MNTLKALKDAYRNSPAARFLLRIAVVALIGYIIGIIDTGEAFSLHALAFAVIGAVCKAAFGLLTPDEPFVGVNKIDVKVPAEHARLDA